MTLILLPPVIDIPVQH